MPRKDELDEPVLYEDITFQKKIYEKVGQSRKRKLNEPNLSYNPTPEFAQVVNKTEILRLANSLTDTNENSYLGKLLKSNDCTPCPFDIMHQDIPSKNKQVELLHFNINDTSVREQLLDNLARLQIAPNPHNATIENLKQTTKITPEQLVEIEQNTRDQSGSLVWFAERQNRITSSNFGAVIKRRKNIYPKSILSKIQCSKPAVSPKPCQWGKDKEELAVMEYLKLKRNAGCCVDVCSKCGFIVNREFPWLGASPDFLVFDPTEEAQIGVGEVKCPFSKRNLSLQEACKDKNFFLEWNNGEAKLKTKHNFFYQIQGCMATLHVKWCDFVVHTEVDLHVERVYFDHKFWVSIVPELSSFYAQYMLP